jgi:outer membrane protein insertion porin family
LTPVQRNFLLLCSLMMILLITTGCNNTRYLTEGETLYTGNKVMIVDEAVAASERKDLERELSEAVRPKPNRSFLGIKFKLTFYNLAGEPKREKGFRNWLRNKIGEPPVLGSSLNIQQNNKILGNYLQNRGFFQVEVDGDKITEDKKTQAEFIVKTGPQYKLRSINYQQEDTSILAAHILETQEKSLLKPGNPYNLEDIKSERVRIDAVLKNEGYYYFSPEFLLAQADTSVGEHEVDLHMKLKYDIMPRNAYRQFRINKVTVYPNYRFNTGSSNRSTRTRQGSAADTLVLENFTMIDRQHTYKPVVFQQAMQFAPGDLYSLREQNMALNRLVGLGVFKFVKNELVAVRDSNTYSSSGLSNLSYGLMLQRGIVLNQQALLDVNYYLTPYPKKNFNIEAGGFTLNDSRAGSRLSFSWRNRNLFRGAELFTVRLTGGFEAQYGGVVRRPNTYSLGAETNLSIPRFLVPFIKVKASSTFPPQTLIKAGYSYYLRTGLYRIHTFNTGFGYSWKEDVRKEHKLFPVNVTYVRTDTLGVDSTGAGGVNFSNLLFNGIIFGPTYEYTFNTQSDGIKRANDFYFQGIADFSGNLVGIAQKADAIDNPQKIFGSSYAQYLKFQTDFRYYRRLNDRQTIAARFLAGYGYSYGNSTQLPNIKQFFSGGSASLRGFNSRLVGPGTYNERYLSGGNTYIEMLGDVKLELSVELRAQLYSIIHGAIFVDAGNIWLQRANDKFPGGQFTSSFYKEFAADAGLGLRFDLSILLVRFDFGIPIRKPWLPEGQRWVLNDLRFGDPEWRKENIIFSLGIGYPF